MKRRNFLRNVILGIAASLLPKILQPLVPEVTEEEMVRIPFNTYIVAYNHPNGDVTYKQGELHYMDLKKSQVEFIEKGMYRLKTNQL